MLLINRRSLEGAQHCAAQTTTGDILESVLIDAWVEGESTQLRVFASDGTIIGAYIHYLDDIPAIKCQNLRVAVPLPVVTQALALSEDRMIELRLEDGDFSLFSLAGIEFKPMNGSYPELEQHIPSPQLTVKSDLPRFDSCTFLRAESAFKAFYGQKKEKVGFGNLTAFVETETCVLHMGAGHAVVVISPLSFCEKDSYPGFFEG